MFNFDALVTMSTYTRLEIMTNVLVSNLAVDRLLDEFAAWLALCYGSMNRSLLKCHVVVAYHIKVVVKTTDLDTFVE